MKQFFLDIKPKDIEAELVTLGLKKFRVAQLLSWVYKKRAENFSECSDLSSELRELLAQKYFLRSFTLRGKKTSSRDGTIRYDFIAKDGNAIPAVFLPQQGRNVACISSQVGCTVACSFCHSGKTKFIRNLSRGEILEQLFAIEKDTGTRISGVLFMGMGEPLLNYTNLVSSLKAILDPAQLGIGKRHVAVSTVGFVPLIEKLKSEKLGVRLALSLHAADDETRRKIISYKVPYSVKYILKAGIEYARATKSRLTVEYILIAGLNDAISSAKKLLTLIRDNSVPKDDIQVNLIPYNPVGTKKWKSPDESAVNAFREYLVKHKVLAMVRESKGADIGSACGQLGV